MEGGCEGKEEGGRENRGGRERGGVKGGRKQGAIFLITCFSFSVSKLGGKRISFLRMSANILALSISVATGAWHISKKMMPRLYRSTFCGCTEGRWALAEGERKWSYAPTGVYLTCDLSSSGDTYMAVPTRPVSPAQFTCSHDLWCGVWLIACT